MSITDGSRSLFGGDWHWRITEQTEHLKKLALHSLSSGLWSRALPENRRLLSEAANCCHCQKFSTKSSGHGRMSHRGRRRDTASPQPTLRGSPEPSTTSPLTLDDQRAEERQLYVLKKKKSLQTFSCDTIKYLVFKLHLSYHNQLRNVSVHMFKFWWKSLDSINIWKYVLCCHLSFFSFPKKTSYSWEAKLVLLVWPSWKVSHRFFSVVILLRKRSVSQP